MPSQARALVVSISKYQHLTPINTHQNAEGVYNALATQCGYPADCIEVLVDEHATREHILTSLNNLCNQLPSEQSRTFIYFSGHGRLCENGLNYIFPVDSSITRYQSTAISSVDIHQCLARASNEITVILDCCWAAGMATTPPGLPALTESSKTDTTPGFSATIEAIINSSSSSSDQPIKRAIISASGMDQRSFVVPGARYSYFTSRLIEGLHGAGIEPPRSREVTLNDLFSYVRQKVGQDTSGQQLPQLSISANIGSLDYQFTRHMKAVTKNYKRDLLIIYDQRNERLEKWIKNFFLDYFKAAGFSFELRDRIYEDRFTAYSDIVSSKFTIVVITSSFFVDEEAAVLELSSGAINAIKEHRSAFVPIRREDVEYSDRFSWLNTFTVVDMTDRFHSQINGLMEKLVEFLEKKMPASEARTSS